MCLECSVGTFSRDDSIPTYDYSVSLFFRLCLVARVLRAPS